MANKIYPKWKEAIEQVVAAAALNGSGATGVYAALVDTGVYTYSDADEFWDEGGASDAIDGLIGSVQEITNKTFLNGLFDGDDVTMPTVTGSTAEAIILFVQNAGAATTYRLFLYMDTGVTNLPVTPNGGNIDITWNASGIVQL